MSFSLTPRLSPFDRVGADLTPLIRNRKGQRLREEMSELMGMSFLRGIPCETEIRRPVL